MGSFASFALARTHARQHVAPPMRIRVAGTFRFERVAAVIRALAIASLLALTACASLGHSSVPPVPPPGLIEPAAPEAAVERSLRVTASAYNSVRGQTDRTPNLGAWGDSLAPGMKVIAVSADLIDLGLARGQLVRIRGLDGEYTVADRMSNRWERKIDIYMGNDVKAARNWGVRKVEILWTPEGN
jgi:3D (Asp-Asp-Asp) domain-containing protein